MDDPALGPNNPNGAGAPVAAADPAPAAPAAADPAPDPADPAPDPAPAPVLPTLGRIVHVNFPGGFDGATEAAGIVASVHGDGSLNVFVFPPNGGAAFSLAGVRSGDERNALPSDSADRNLPAWYWPPRP